jgi:regulatory LuxR family protein
VLALLAAGTPNQQIASEPVVAAETVKKHISHIPGKLGAANRAQAAARARRWACSGRKAAPFSYLLRGSEPGIRPAPRLAKIPPTPTLSGDAASRGLLLPSR